MINATEARYPVVTPITFDIGDFFVVCVCALATPEERRVSALKLRHAGACACFIRKMSSRAMDERLFKPPAAAESRAGEVISAGIPDCSSRDSLAEFLLGVSRLGCQCV